MNMHSVQHRNGRTLSTSSDSSTGSTSSSSGKLMSISSIIAAPPLYSPPSALVTPGSYNDNPMERRASAPSYSYNAHTPHYTATPLLRSPPTSPGIAEKYMSATPLGSPTSPAKSPYSTRHQSYYRHHQQSHHLHYPLASPPHLGSNNLEKNQLLRQPKSMDDFMMESEEVDAIMNEQGMPQQPLTLQERRLRNKAASAKYRQKKNQQQNEMRMMISRLSEQNAVLERQLQEVRLDNERLRATADRLRGKMVAKKMLKKWIGKQSIADPTSTATTDNNDVALHQQEHQQYNTHSAVNSANAYSQQYSCKNANNNRYTYSESSGSGQEDNIHGDLLTSDVSDQGGDGEDDELESMDSN